MDEKKLVSSAPAAKSLVKNEKKTMQNYIKSMEGEIAKALPSVITPERFTRIVLSALSTNPKLQECTPQSFLGAMMASAQLGMECNTPLGQAYLIPYSDRKRGVTECQFQLGYKGLMDLAYRSGEISRITAETVYENDEFEYSLGLEPNLVHKPCMGERGNPIGYYATFRTKDGCSSFAFMSKSDMDKHAKTYSKTFNFGPWQTNYDSMAKKTVLKQVLKYAPMKSDFARAVTQDETIKKSISEDMYTVPDETPFADFVDVDPTTGEVKE